MDELDRSVIGLGPGRLQASGDQRKRHRRVTPGEVDGEALQLRTVDPVEFASIVPVGDLGAVVDERETTALEVGRTARAPAVEDGRRHGDARNAVVVVERRLAVRRRCHPANLRDAHPVGRTGAGTLD